MSVESELFDSISQAVCVNNRPINARKERQKNTKSFWYFLLWVGCVFVYTWAEIPTLVLLALLRHIMYFKA